MVDICRWTFGEGPLRGESQPLIGWSVKKGVTLCSPKYRRGLASRANGVKGVSGVHLLDTPFF